MIKGLVGNRSASMYAGIMGYNISKNRSSLLRCSQYTESSARTVLPMPNLLLVLSTAKPSLTHRVWSRAFLHVCDLRHGRVVGVWAEADVPYRSMITIGDRKIIKHSRRTATQDLSLRRGPRSTTLASRSRYRVHVQCNRHSLPYDLFVRF